MMNKSGFIVFSLILLFPLFITAQENIEYQHKEMEIKPHQKRTNSLKVPFFDDFSTSYGMVNNALWENSGAFVNNAYAVNPISAGTATFDACDYTGKIYEQAEFNNQFVADVLSSLPLDLSAPSNNNVFFSFYYQAQGIANAPEKEDSLVLQFYSPLSQSWKTVWYANGDTMHDFVYVILPVNQEEYLQDGFRFRFFNYVSFNSNSTNSTISNADFWHLDYIYLNANRSILDNNFQDIAMLNISNTFLNSYTAIPWNHFLDNPDLQSSNFNIQLRNNDLSGRKIKERSVQYTETVSSNQSLNYQFGAVNIAAEAIQNYQFEVPFNFDNNFADSAEFEIKAHFLTDDYDYAQNNEITHIQKFKDFYAYDDGTSEASYGIIGEGARNAMFAYQFVSYTDGYLSAVDMYFNQPLLETYSKPFYLTVWECSNGVPTEIIYRKEGVRPQFDGDLNQFVRFRIDSVTAIRDTFFVGWIQTTEYSLNVGYDLNTNSADKAYYNISGQWQKSALNGSVMLRPVITDTPSFVEENKLPSTLNIYPNPANEWIKIAGTENTGQIKIIDLYGKTVLNEVYSGQDIRVDAIPEGFYIILFYNDNQVIATQKLLIKH